MSVILERKSFPFEVKTDSKDDYTFEGYASVFGNEDSHKDIIEPGAFKKTIKENKTRMKVLWQHLFHVPIGLPKHVEEDSKGLYVKAKISETSQGKDAVILMKDGVINELSIGFNTLKELYDKVANVRKIKEVRLWEFSPVTWGSNDLAKITGTKSIEGYLFDLNQELKEGKIVSKKNKNLVLEAIDALKALLSEEEEQEKPPTIDESKEVKEIFALLNEMKSFK